MKQLVLLPYGLAAALLITACGPSPAQPQPSTSPAALSREELEARFTPLSDGLGEPFELLAREEMEAAVQELEAVWEGAQVRPKRCQEQAAVNLSQARFKATEGVVAVGAAGELDGTLLIALFNDAPGIWEEQGLIRTPDQLAECDLVVILSGDVQYEVRIDEQPQDLIGDETFALSGGTKIDGGLPEFSLVVNARGNGLIASAQYTGADEGDGLTQAQLSDLAADLIGVDW